jgi:hypothetical protein
MEFNVDDIVKISPDAVYYTGQRMSALIKSKSWRIKSISGDRIVLGVSSDGYYALNAPVHAKYLRTID